MSQWSAALRELRNKGREDQGFEERELETVRATLESARSDYSDELRRGDVLDTKLTNLAGFAGLSLSISGSVGGSAVVSGGLPAGFSIAVGVTLSVAVVFLLATVLACFLRLTPQEYDGLATRAAKDRVEDESRLQQDPREALVNLAATYYLRLLPQHREINMTKVDRLTFAYTLVAFGFGALALSLVVAVAGAVT